MWWHQIGNDDDDDVDVDDDDDADARQDIKWLIRHHRIYKLFLNT